MELASKVGKPLADRKAKQTQACRDAYQSIANGEHPKSVLETLLTKLKGKKCKDEKAVVKAMCKGLNDPPLRLKWPYPLVRWY